MSYNLKSTATSAIERIILRLETLLSDQSIIIQNQEDRISALEAGGDLFNALEDIVTNNTTQISGLQSQITSLQSQITSLQTLSTTETNRINTLTTDLTATNISVTQNQSDITSLNGLVSTNADNIQSLNTSTTTSISGINTTVQSNISQLTQQNNKITALQSSSGANTASIVSLTTKSNQNATNITTLTTNISTLQTTVSGFQSQIDVNTSAITTNTTQITGLNTISGNHSALLVGLRTDIDSINGVSQSDITNLQNDVSTINTTLTSLDTRAFNNSADIFQLQTNGHTEQIASLQSTVSGNSATISTIQSNLTFQSNSLGILTSRVNTQADSISGVMTDVDNLADTVSNFSSSIGSITTLTDNVNSLTSQVSTISSRAFANMQQISTSRNHIAALQPIVASHTTSISSINTSLTDIQSSITSLEQGGSSSGLQTQIDTLRTDTDANTLLGSQLLTALQYQSTTIFAIDTAIQISNGKIEMLETSQITQDNLIREFDQLFNEPVNGVVGKLNNIISTYNTHISGVYLTLRQNVDSNNLILGTLSTHTTSLLTAMTQVNSRVQVLEDNASSAPSTPQFSSSSISVAGVSQSTLSAIGSGWTQIKYLSGTSNSWFPGNGNLNGNTGKTEFLFTSGDFSKWLICDISQAIGSFYSDSPRFITKSSISSVEYTATWYNRQSYAPEDPWISLENFFVSAENGTVMFGENSIVGYQDSIHPSGMYVFVR